MRDIRFRWFLFGFLGWAAITVGLLVRCSGHGGGGPSNAPIQPVIPCHEIKCHQFGRYTNVLMVCKDDPILQSDDFCFIGGVCMFDCPEPPPGPSPPPTPRPTATPSPTPTPRPCVHDDHGCDGHDE